jgi:predicted transcriptional regulator
MSKPDKLPPLSEGQMDIMNILWRCEEATLADIWKELSAERPVAKNTVQTLLSRLVDKGWLSYRAEGKVFHYRAAAAREKSLRVAAQRFLSNAFGGSTEGLMMALLDGKTLTKEEAQRIRMLIEKAESQEGKE